MHPSFRDGSAEGYPNGEWDSELPGFWVAKFMAGFAGGNNNVTPKNSGLKYTGEYTVQSSLTEPDEVYDNFYTASENIVPNVTDIKYPVFLPKTYAYNYMNVGDMYNISKALTNNGNPYQLNGNRVDSHLIKNSEWGAVSYLTHSKYGVNYGVGGRWLYKNNVNINEKIPTIGGITGYGAHGQGINVENQLQTLQTSYGDTLTGITAPGGTEITSYAWNTENGFKASTSHTIYGVFDMDGCLWEANAGYIPVQAHTKALNRYRRSFCKKW